MKRKHLIKTIILSLLLIYIGLLTIPYIPHKKVSEAYKKQFAKRNFYNEHIGNERVAYINNNDDALLYRLHMIKQAEKEVILSTFDFNSDKAGRDMMAAMLEAADRGVSVRIIIDGVSGLLDVKGDPYFQALASHEHVSIHIYNPVNLLKPWKAQARLHDKYLIIDEKMYLLGGRNTANLFLGNYSKSKNIDRELFVYESYPQADASIHQVRDYFEAIWSLPDSKPFTCKKLKQKAQTCLQELNERRDYLTDTYPEAYKTWNYEELTFAANRVSLLSNPIDASNKEPHMWYSLNQLMRNSKQVRVYTPYIICGKEMYADLTDLSNMQIPVEIITNDVASGANPWGCTDYLNQKKHIHETGVAVYEFMGDHSCHTKALLLDDRMSIVGSYNMDMRSTYQDTELMLAVDCKELNAQIQKEMDRDKTYSKTMLADGTYELGEHYREKELSTGKKIFYGILRVVVMPIRRFL